MTTLQAAGAGASAGTAAAGTAATAATSLGYASTAAALAGPVGLAIVAVAALAAALGATKGKTQHLNYDEAKALSLKFAESLGHAMEDNYGWTLSLQIGKKLAATMASWLEGHYLNPGSKSWQTWIGNAITDIKNRANGGAQSDITSLIYLYGTYVGMNYDATRPAEFAEVMAHDMTLFFQSMDSSNPDWGLLSWIWPSDISVAQAKANQSYLEQTIGLDVGTLTKNAPAAVTPQTASPVGTAPTTKSVVTANVAQIGIAIALLFGIVKLVSLKR